MASKQKKTAQNKRKIEEDNDIKPIASKRKRVLTRKLRDTPSDIVSVTSEVPIKAEPTPAKAKREKKTPAVKKKTPKKIVGATQKKETKKKPIKITEKKPKIVKKKIDNKPIQYGRVASLESINEGKTKKQIIKVKLPKRKLKKKATEDQNHTIAEMIENNLEQDFDNPEKYIIIKVPVSETMMKKKSTTKTKQQETSKVKKIRKPKNAATKIKKRITAKKVVNSNLKRGKPKKTVTEVIEYNKGTKDDTPVKHTINSFEQKYIRRLSLSSVSCRNSELSDALSWTKEMNSTSKSCSPVSINDIVKIDGKIPLVTVLKDEMLPVINKNITSPSYSDLIHNNSLNLSSATSSTCLHSDTTGGSSYSLFTSLGLSKSNDDNKSIDKKLEENLELIKSKVNSFDVEFVTWSMRDFEDKPIHKEKLADIIVKAFKHELDLLEKCKQMRPLTNIYNKKQNDKESSVQSLEIVTEEPIIETVIPTVDKEVANQPNEFVKPSPVITHRKTSVNVENVTNPTAVRNDQVDNNDDDCLSIYDSADSFWINKYCDMSDPVQKQSDLELISDMELSDSESEYVPCKDNSKEEVQNKTENKIQNDKTPIVCEKQNADTTFTDDRVAITDPIVEKQSVAMPNTNKEIFDINTSTDPIKLVTPNFTPIQIIKSTVFSGLCIFNLMGSCKSYACRFNHRRPKQKQVISNLEKIGNFTFIQEYMLIRDKIGLIDYLPSFVRDCLRRQLWDLLAEMAIDIYKYPNIMDNTLRMSVLEQILLGFNGCDLNSVKLLDYTLSVGYLLCHMFLRMIAQSSNFTQFKEVFIKLCDHFESKKHIVSLNIAIPIVERVCLIAYNKQVVEATLKIVLNTEHSILNTKYMETFEKLLNCSLLDNSLLNKWKQFKKESSREDNTVIPNTMENGDVPRYTSPDTTHLENANKLESSLCAKMDTLNPFNMAKQTVKHNSFDVYIKPNVPQETYFKRNYAFPSDPKPLGRWNTLNRQRHPEDTKSPWQRRNYNNKTANRPNNKQPNFFPHGQPNYFKP